MGIVRDYLKYVKGPVLNAVTGPKGNILLTSNGKNCLTTASEDVVLYDNKTHEKVKTYLGESSEASIIDVNIINGDVATGYVDGSIQLYHQNENEPFVTFHGHKSSITTLNFDALGQRLVSGAQDNFLVVWDIIDESGLFKLKGHKGNITQCKFLTSSTLNLQYVNNSKKLSSEVASDPSTNNIIISTSKDGTIKFWDLVAQHCFKTIYENGSEIWDFVVLPDPFSSSVEFLAPTNFRLVSITSDNLLRMWSLKANIQSIPNQDFSKFKSENSIVDPCDNDYDALMKNYFGENEGKNENIDNSNVNNALNKENIKEITNQLDSLLIITFLGSFARNTKFHGIRLVVDPQYMYLGCHGNDKTLTIYSIKPPSKLLKFYKKKFKNLQQSEIYDEKSEKNIPQHNSLIKRDICYEITPMPHLDFHFKDVKIKSAALYTFNNTHIHDNPQYNTIETELVNNIDSENKNISVKQKKKLHKKSFAKMEDEFLKNVGLKVCIMQSNNKIAIYETNTSPSSSSLTFDNNDNIINNNYNNDNWRLCSLIDGQGHETDVRTLSISSDESLVLSASGQSVKIWNRLTQRCIRSMACEYGLCSLFLPADKFAAIGSKTGKVHLYDCQTGDLIENIIAHDGPVWAMALHPNQEAIITGGGEEHTVKVWKLELIITKNETQNNESSIGLENLDENLPGGDLPSLPNPNISKRLTLVHAQTLHIGEDVLCLKASRDEKFLAVGLLDNTVKIFFLDTLKFYLSLYGHSMPVTCLDINWDSSLLVTGSNDKLIKIWGAKFGDCHRTLRGHCDTVTAICFVQPASSSLVMMDDNSLERDLNLFFSAGKDGIIIQWDAVKFEKIFVLQGHHAEIWALACCPNYLVSASHDKTIRFWYKTDEILNPADEAETAAAAESEKRALDLMPPNIPTINIDPKTGELISNTVNNQSSALASAKSLETLDATERLIQALDIYVKQIEAQSGIAVKKDKSSTKIRSADALSDSDDMEDEDAAAPANSDEGFQDESSPSGDTDEPQQSLTNETLAPKVKTLGEILLERRQQLQSILPILSTNAVANDPSLAERFVMDTCLKNIKYSELQYATLLLPRAYVTMLIELLDNFISSTQSQPKHNPETVTPAINPTGVALGTSLKSDARVAKASIDGASLEICVKLLCFLCKTQISLPATYNVGNDSVAISTLPDHFQRLVTDLKGRLTPLVAQYRDRVGFNKTVMRFLQRQLDEKQNENAFSSEPFAATRRPPIIHFNKNKKSGKRHKTHIKQL